MSRPVTLVLGGARSGKSSHAEALVRATGLARIYVATAAAHDAEMTERIARHRTDRAADGWRTVEEQFDLAAVLAREARPDQAVLVECLTLWLSNLMLDGRDVAAEQQNLLSALHTAPGPVVLVANEVGLGLVPDTPLGRAFRDAQGRLNRAVAALACRVVFVAAGLPLVLKGKA